MTLIRQLPWPFDRFHLRGWQNTKSRRSLSAPNISLPAKAPQRQAYLKLQEGGSSKLDSLWFSHLLIGRPLEETFQASPAARRIAEGALLQLQVTSLSTCSAPCDPWDSFGPSGMLPRGISPFKTKSSRTTKGSTRLAAGQARLSHGRSYLLHLQQHNFMQISTC